MKLRTYQQEAVAAVYEHLRTRDDNPCVVLPTGTGKSLCIAQIVSDAVQKWSGRVLILAHVKELLEQNADKIRALCPELDVGVYSAGLNSRDTDHAVIVAGIQSVYTRACELGPFDLVIVDEAHLIAPDGEGMYRTFLADAKVVNPNLRIIGLTATPFRMKGGLICKPENLLNHICYEAGLKEMIAQGYLSPLVSRAGRAAVSFDGLHVRGGEFISSEVESLMDNSQLVDAACREIVNLTQERNSVLIFTSSVEHCNHVAEKIAAYSGTECGIVTGSTSPGLRAEIIARFKGEEVSADFFSSKSPLRYLANVNVLTTGFDATNTDCIVLLRPTNSAGLLVQMVGRGTRLHPGKKNCIAEGTPILTDKGVVPIEKVTTEMRLWDGVEFVSHDGAVCKGVKNVIKYAGLAATPDHKVWCGNHWRTFGDCCEKAIPISLTEYNGKAIRETDGRFRRGDCCERCEQPPEQNFCSGAMPMWRNGMEELGQFPAGKSWLQSMCQTAKSASLAGSKSNCRQTEMRKSRRPAICGLRRTWNQVQVFRANRNGCLSDGTLRLQTEYANRPNRQQQGLCPRQSQNDHCQYKSNEHSAPTEDKNVAIQNETSGNQICGCDNMQSIQQGNERGRNHKEVLSLLNKTKRRVWDILNAGPRHRFTAAGLLVSNCLVLDYGGNIMRHGPVDMIQVKEPGNGNGEAPAKKCPECLALIHAAYMTCPECGYAFPPPEKSNLNAQAESAGVLSGQVSYFDYDIHSVEYSVHHKRGAPDDAPKTMRIEYCTGFNRYESEWVCPEHSGYARRKFEAWWKRRSKIAPPVTAQEAVRLADDGALAKPSKIIIKSVAGEKFPSIADYELGPIPDYCPEPGWNDLSEQEQRNVFSPDDFDDEEIPF